MMKKLRSLAIVLASVGVIGCNKSDVKPIDKKPEIRLEAKLDLNRARINHNHRQVFLDEFQDKYKIKHCKELVYDPGLNIARSYFAQLAKKFNYAP